MSLVYIKIIFISFSGLLLSAVLLLWLRYQELKMKFWEKYMGAQSLQTQQAREQAKQAQVARLSQSWQQLKQKVDSGGYSELKLGVIEADKLIDQALKMQGIEGQDMGDRLKNAQKQGVSRLDRAWTVHKARNQLVHGQGELSEERLRLVFQEAERILRSWNII